MPELVDTCAAAEPTVRRVTRNAAISVLLAVCLVEVGMSGLMVDAMPRVPQLLYLLCTVMLLTASVLAVRERRGSTLAVRVSAVLAAVMLFWCMAQGSTPTISFAGHLHDLMPLLAGLLLLAMLLAGVIRLRSDAPECNCG